MSTFVLRADEIQIYFEYPDITGDFYVAGTVFFPPGSVSAVDNIIVVDKTSGNEIASNIRVQEQWPDGSILSAEIIFASNIQKKTIYLVRYGNDVKRKKTFSEPAVLPTVSFITPGSGQTDEKMDVSVGQINVRIDRSAGIRYWWYVLPAFIFIFFTVLRSLRTIRMQKE